MANDQRPSTGTAVRFVLISWGCARNLWPLIARDVRNFLSSPGGARTGLGGVTAGCELRINSMSFADFVHGVYEVDDISQQKQKIKLAALERCHTASVLVLNATTEEPRWRDKSNGKQLSMTMEELKEHVRSRYQKQIPNYIHDVILHAADNYDVHTRHLDGLLAKAGLRQAKTGLTNVCQCANQTQQQQLIPPARADAPDASPVVDTRSAGGPRQVEQVPELEMHLILLSHASGWEKTYNAALRTLDVLAVRVHAPIPETAVKLSRLGLREAGNVSLLVLFERRAPAGSATLPTSPTVQQSSSIAEAKAYAQALGYDYDECKERMMTRPKVWEGPLQLFHALNARGIQYVVSRNYEGLPEDILVGSHGDLDLMALDFQTTIEVMHALPMRSPWNLLRDTGTGDARVFTMMTRSTRLNMTANTISNVLKLPVDVLTPATSYIDPQWMEAILARRVTHQLGFYVMRNDDYFYFLLFHGLIHKKGFFAPEYLPRLHALATKLPSPLPRQLINALSTSAQQVSKQVLMDELNKYLQGHGYRVTHRKID